MSSFEATPLPPGWYIKLGGEAVDLDDWDFSLNPPFDPIVIKDEDGAFLLDSSDVRVADSAEEARERGLAIIARLNGAMRLMHNCAPVKLHNIVRVDEAGLRHQYVFAEMAAFEFGRCIMRATAVALGPDGKPLQPQPPQPSAAQQWNDLAADDDRVADLLEQCGRAHDWYEIYKTIELAEHIAGGQHKLEKLLGTSKSECANMRQTANFYRHARARRPTRLTTLREAKPLLNYVVKVALDRAGA